MNAERQRPVKVLAWVPQPLDTSPGQRFRIEQWEPWLRREGIAITYSSFADLEQTRRMQRPGQLVAKAREITHALFRRVLEAARARAYDVVYIFREGALLGPAVAERLLVARGVPFVFDFDDSVWVRYVSPANSYLSYLRFPGKTTTLCRKAARVFAGNATLQEYALRYNPNVSLVPTTIDTEKYQALPARQPSIPVVGWTGSYSSEQYLEVVRPALEALARRHSFRLVVVGGGGFAVAGVTVEHRPWRSETEVEDLSDFDIGMMPLPDTEWERGKCGLKALQYMALGVPAVVSPVGVNSEIVHDAENGFTARDAREWEQRLEALLTDAALRRRLGLAGRQTVEERYSARVHALRVASLLRSVVE